jgi:hypothetical protein
VLQCLDLAWRTVKLNAPHVIATTKLGRRSRSARKRWRTGTSLVTPSPQSPHLGGGGREDGRSSSTTHDRRGTTSVPRDNMHMLYRMAAGVLRHATTMAAVGDQRGGSCPQSCYSVRPTSRPRAPASRAPVLVLLHRAALRRQCARLMIRVRQVQSELATAPDWSSVPRQLRSAERAAATERRSAPLQQRLSRAACSPRRSALRRWPRGACGLLQARRRTKVPVRRTEPVCRPCIQASHPLHAAGQ